MRLKLFAAAAGSAALVFVLVLAPASFAVQRVDGVTAKPDWFDSRAKASATPTAAQRDAVAALVGRAGAGTRVTWDHRFGTPRTILTRRATSAAVGRLGRRRRARVGRRQPRRAGPLGRRHPGPRGHARPCAAGTDTHVVDLQQVVAGGRRRGRPAHRRGHRQRPGAQLRGRLRPQPRRSGRRVRADRAGAGQGGGVARAGVAFRQPERDRRGLRRLRARPVRDRAARRQGRVPAGRRRAAGVPGAVRAKLDEGYDVVLDAGTGAVLYRRSLVAHESEGSVYENSGAPQGGTQVTRSFGPRRSRRAATPTRRPGRDGGPTTFGNNATPTRTTRTSSFRPTRARGRSADEPVRLPVRHELAAHQRPGRAAVYARLDPATTNLFWQHNRITTSTTTRLHRDRRQLPARHFGKGGSGGDAVSASCTRGGQRWRATYTGRDNAYFLEQPDGAVVERHVPGSRSTDSRARSRTATRCLGVSTSTRTACPRATSAAARRSAREGRWERAGATGTRSTTSRRGAEQGGEESSDGNATRGIRNWDYDTTAGRRHRHDSRPRSRRRRDLDRHLWDREAREGTARRRARGRASW